MDERDKGSLRREPISISKLAKGNAKWATQKILLGWIIDTVNKTIELPTHRADRLLSILIKLSRKKESLRTWQKYLGENTLGNYVVQYEQFLEEKVFLVPYIQDSQPDE